MAPAAAAPAPMQKLLSGKRLARRLKVLTACNPASIRRSSAVAIDHAIELQARMTILHVWDVDMRSEMYCASIAVECRWRCPDGECESALRDGADQLDADWEPEWTPHLGIWGTVEQYFERRTFWAATDEAGAVWLYGLLRLAARMVERYDLEIFPFDLQDINVMLMCFNATLLPLGDAAAAVRVEQSGCSLPDFELLPAMPALHRLVSAREQPHGHSSLHAVLFYRRHAGFFLWNVISLLLLISLCATASWAIHFRQVDSRLALDVTLLLVTVTFKQVLTALVPPISYLTLLDVYSLACIAQARPRAAAPRARTRSARSTRSMQCRARRRSIPRAPAPAAAAARRLPARRGRLPLRRLRHPLGRLRVALPHAQRAQLLLCPRRLDAGGLQVRLCDAGRIPRRPRHLQWLVRCARLADQAARPRPLVRRAAVHAARRRARGLRAVAPRPLAADGAARV